LFLAYVSTFGLLCSKDHFVHVVSSTNSLTVSCIVTKYTRSDVNFCDLVDGQDQLGI